MFGLTNFVTRWLFTMFVVFGTYNPTGRSFWHWAQSDDAIDSVVAAVLIALTIIGILYLRTTFRSIKPMGTILLVIFFAAFGYVLIDLGIYPADERWQVEVLLLTFVSTILTLGLTFSAIRARISGQIDSDDVGSP